MLSSSRDPSEYLGMTYYGRHMIRHILASLVCATTLTACAPSSPLGMSGMPDMDRMSKKQDLMQKLMNDPQVPAWYETRNKITMAVGDRVFDKSFDQVFDGIT